MNRAAALLSIVALSPVSVCLFAAEQRAATASAAEAALLPGADFLARIDVARIESSPAGRELFRRWLGPLAERLGAGGLALADLGEIVVSAETGAIVDGDAGGDRQGARTVVAVSLRAAIDPATLEAVLVKLWEGVRVPHLSRFGDATVIEMRAPDPDPPSLFAATSSSGSVVFLSTRRDELEGAVTRESRAEHEPVGEELALIEGKLPADVEVSASFLAPARLLERISGRESADPERLPTMPERILEPFRALSSVALTIDLDEDAGFVFLAELESPDAAERLEAVLASFIVPSLEALLSSRLGITLDLVDAVVVETNGTTTRLSLRLDASTVQALSPSR